MSERAHFFKIPLEMATAGPVVRLRHRLARQEVRLLLIDLWEWDWRRNFGTPAPPSVIEDVAGWTGDAGAFASAAVAEGFLREAADGLAVVPWEQVIKRLPEEA